jgi:Aspartyl protease
MGLKEDPPMRSNGHSRWSRPARLSKMSPRHGRLFAIIAALAALALAIGACSMSTSQASGDNGGFSSNSGSVTTGSGQTTPVKILRGGGGTALVLVPITIDGSGPYDFALDTGAGITLIDTELADSLQLPVTGDSAQVAGVGGTQDVSPVHIASWSAGKIGLPDATVGKTGLASFKHNSDVRGLLGSDILSRFGRITINYDTGELSASNPALQADVVTPSEMLREAVKESDRPRAA